jgi:hypothetical protein
MTDEQNDAANEAEAPETGESSVSGQVPKTFARKANSNLRVARRSLEAVDWQPDERASHLIAEANVYALLDLADAIRNADISSS